MGGVITHDHLLRLTDLHRGCCCCDCIRAGVVAATIAQAGAIGNQGGGVK